MSAQLAQGDRPETSRDAFIVVAALWILLALATLASVAAAYVSQSAIALRANDETVRTEALVAASLELTAYRLSSNAAIQRPTRGAFRFRQSRAEVTVEFRSEAARIDLNNAPKELIAGLFAALGAPPEAAAQYADRIVAWRSAPQQNAADSEAALYRVAGLRYPPRRAPFSHMDELWLVLNLPPALVERALPFLTIYSGMAEVNVLDAPAEVIAALPGMTAGRLNAFLGQRDNLPADPQFVAGALGDSQAGATVKGSDAYRVRTSLVLDNGWRKTSEAVIMMVADSPTVPYLVLSWRDDIDAAASARPAGGGGG
jgi:general secretion pathway protein K